MVAQASDVGIIAIKPKDLAAIAVSTIENLGYKISRASKQLNRISASEKKDEHDGRDVYRYDWRLALTWRKAEDGTYVTVTISEQTGTARESDCFKRCERLLIELENDAIRAQEVAEDHEPSTVYGAAKWGTESEFREKGYVIKKPEAKRLLLARYGQNEYLCVPELSTYMHALVCGRTGAGKSSGFIEPNLYERLSTNMIVTEATPGLEPGELYMKTSGWRKLAGHKIYSFNPSDMTSTRINPLDAVKDALPELQASEAEKLADLIIRGVSREGSRVDPTWDNSEKLLMVSLILHAAASDERHSHIGYLRWMLLSGVESIMKTMKGSQSRLARQEFEGWLNNTSENFRFSVTSGLLTKLNPWMTDQTIALTYKTDFTNEDLRNNLFTFYVSVPSNRGDMKKVSSLIFNYLLNFVVSERKNMKYPLALFLDEFTNFGYIPGIANVLSIIRKTGIGLVLGFQDYLQLEEVYASREAQIIISQPATQIYFRQKYKEAKALSEALGRITVQETEVLDSGRVQERVLGRNLMTIDELVNLDKDYVIIMTPDTWPVKLKKIPPGSYNPAAEYEPPERPIHEVSEFIRNRGEAEKTDWKKNTKAPQQDKKQNSDRRESQMDFREKKNKPKEEERKTKPRTEAPDPGDDLW